MRKKAIFALAVLAALVMPLSIAGDFTVVQAVEDITMDIENMDILNTDTLTCEVDSSYYGEDETLSVSMVQFDISDVRVGDNDVCVLLLKAASVEKRVSSESAQIGLSVMSSDWTEDSSLLDLANAVTASGPSASSALQASDLDTDSIFAFDVSNRVKEVSAADDLISFSLIAVGDTDYRVDFKSRETGEGPCLLVMPYPLPITAVEG